MSNPLAPGQPLNYKPPTDRSFLSKNYIPFEHWCQRKHTNTGDRSIRSDSGDVDTSEIIKERINNLFVDGADADNTTYILFGDRHNNDEFTYNSPQDIISIVCSHSSTVLIEGGWIGTVILIGCGKSEIRIRNCKIGNVTIVAKYPPNEGGIDRNKDVTCNRVAIEGSEIGTLDIKSAVVDHLYIRSGTIRKILTYPDKTPFNGLSSHFIYSSFPTNSKHSHIFSGPQTYRNMRKHMDALDDTRSSMFFRQLELEAERPSESGTIRLVSEFNRLLSDYGRKPGRPLIAAAALLAVTTLILMITDSTVPGGSLPSTWDTYLGDSTWSAKFLRSAMAAFQSINPLTIFDTRKAVVTNNPVAAVFVAIIGLIVDALLTQTVIAVRRRFKMESPTK